MSKETGKNILRKITSTVGDYIKISPPENAEAERIPSRHQLPSTGTLVAELDQQYSQEELYEIYSRLVDLPWSWKIEKELLQLQLHYLGRKSRESGGRPDDSSLDQDISI